jgi:hypothetical protein
MQLGHGGALSSKDWIQDGRVEMILYSVLMHLLLCCVVLCEGCVVYADVPTNRSTNS